MYETTLTYGGRKVKWNPTSVHLISHGGPLSRPEPEYIVAGGSIDEVSRAIKYWLESGYVACIQLQPGDGTRYTLILSPTENGCTVTRAGVAILSSFEFEWKMPLEDPEGCSEYADSEVYDTINCVDILSNSNAWTAQFFYWWLETLRRNAIA